MAIVILTAERTAEENLTCPRRTLESEPRAHPQPRGNTVLPAKLATLCPSPPWHRRPLTFACVVPPPAGSPPACPWVRLLLTASDPAPTSSGTPPTPSHRVGAAHPAFRSP